MAFVEPRSAEPGRPLARAERRAREARERGLRAATRAAPPSAPGTSAPGCGSWAGRKTGDSSTPGR